MGAMRTGFGGLGRGIDGAPRDNEEKEVNDHHERPMFTTRPMLAMWQVTMEKMKVGRL